MAPTPTNAYDVVENDASALLEGSQSIAVKLQNEEEERSDLRTSGSEKEMGKKDEKEEKTQMIGLFQVFKFARAGDKVLMFFGSFAAVIHGSALPLLLFVFGDMIDSFVNTGDICKLCANATDLINIFNNNTNSHFNCDDFFSQSDSNKAETQKFIDWMQLLNISILPNSFTQDKLLSDMRGYAIYYTAIGGGVLLTAYISLTFWTLAAKHQARRIRLLFFRAILRQDTGWFDTNPAGELTTRLSDDVDKIEAGIGEKMSTFIQMICSAVAGIALGFYNSWELTLVILASSPLLMAAAFVMDKVNKDSTAKELDSYAHAGSVAQEVISSIRTVVAFGGQDKESSRYDKQLADAKRSGIKRGVYTGLAMGFVMVVVYLAYALGFWYGSRMVLREDGFTVGKMLIVFFSVLVGSFSLGQAMPALQELAASRGAAYFVYNLIGRVPTIDVEADVGEQPLDVKGTLSFKDVFFNYPSRADVQVLRGLNLEIGACKTVALVGASGCGKSTCIQLIQRFYDPLSGSVTLDGRDFRSLNLKWLRSQIGVVSQEPVLFATTIAENIRYGRDDVTDDEIHAAAKAANAHNFINLLPDKYETLVGSRGAQLSGGQKQRIAIARALVKNPRILLLDEATSALDTESEASVQEALDKAREGRTTIIVAHRLTTVQNADLIVALQDGRVAEQGTHAELMALDSVYASLVRSQTKKPEDDEDSEEEIDAIELQRTISTEGVVRKRTLTGTEQESQHQIQRLLSNVSNPSQPTDTDVETPGVEIKAKPVGMCTLLGWNSREWFFIFLGCLGSLVEGGANPAMSVALSKILAGFISCSEDKMRTNSEFYSLMFVAIGGGLLIASFIRSSMFGISGEKLTERIRSRAFKSILRQDISFFDDHKNGPGALTTRLATEASAVKGATGSSLGSVCNSLSGLGVGIAIAFYYSWKLTLAILAFVPFIGLAGFVEMKVFRGGGSKNKELYEKSGKIASESIENIRTVQSLGKERLFYQKYEEQSTAPYKSEVRMAQGLGVTYSVSQGIIYFAYAASFYLGAYLITIKDITFEDMMIAFNAVVFGAMAVGQATSFAPSYRKGVEAAAELKALFEREPIIDSYSVDGEKPHSYNASVEFKDIAFRYPTRKTVRVLQGLSLRIASGETLALVGSSGCGKSTTVQLIERFYDPDSGTVLIDGRPLDALNIAWLRNQIGIVSQEPVLFDRSIAENIAYGANDRQLSMDEIMLAARKANIHDFITSLPLGYETRVGDKGTQLSGGQKQRVAIARALVRDPKILLLDEATSALDSESERIVQEALDKAREGRTCIVIAHRLSTIQYANKIAVIKHGHVTELGSHQELMDRRGFYYKLQSVQRKE